MWVTAVRPAPARSFQVRPGVGVEHHPNDAGVARRVLTGDEFGKYELSEDLTEHHHHLICSSCGRTTDVTLPALLEKRLDQVIDEVAERADFADVVHRLDVIGTCADCATS